ncbi:hypothetical protein UlMin_023343 [Ulmus minor]
MYSFFVDVFEQSSNESVIPTLEGCLSFLESCTENFVSILSMYENWDKAIILFFRSLKIVQNTYYQIIILIATHSHFDPSRNRESLLLRESVKKVVGHGGKGRNPFPFSLSTLSSSYSFFNFEARLEDGTVVAKSDGVELTVREGYFYPALSKAVKTMKKGKVIKKIVKEGEGYERPNEGAIIKLKLTGKLQDGTMFLKKGYNEGEELFEFKTDKVIEGLDKAMLTLKKGEVALLSIAPKYAFGSFESQHELAVVLANSIIYYDVELVSFEKEKESWDLNTEEKIVAAGRKKKEGNVLFKVGKYARASKRYNKAKALKVACNLNNAACKLKLEDYKQAEKLCTKVLETQSKNVKALYRRAQAYIQLANLDLAEFDIKKALEIDPEIRDVKQEYKKLKEYNKKEAKFYGNMFAKMSKLDTHESDEAEPLNVDTKA